MKHSDVVFRGTITDLRDTGKGYGVVVFRITRVWKGHVGPILEMPALVDPAASPCVSLLWPGRLEIGGDLLVYAHKVNDGTLLTSTCSRTRFARDSQDFKILGAGRPPNSN